jgi:hypothetical protein
VLSPEKAARFRSLVNRRTTALYEEICAFLENEVDLDAEAAATETAHAILGIAVGTAFGAGLSLPDVVEFVEKTHELLPPERRTDA